MAVGAADKNDEVGTGAMGPVPECTGLVDSELVLGCEVGGGYHDERLGRIRVGELKRRKLMIVDLRLVEFG